MDSAEIARRYLAHFEARGHAIVPSASLVADDPTLLFVVAGMQPFKPFLLGQQVPPWRRVADAQKVVRTLDIEEVGKTTRHATFFQMLGNWSFGDYFKEDAISWAWQLLTNSQADGGFGFPPEKLWATVLHGDDETYAIWRDQVGVPEARIQRRGLKDNYWHMGVPGPGGPCSEIYFDKGPEHGREGGPEVDEDRYLEVWNLVFMQDMLSEVRAKDDFDVEAPLPHRNVDTGMGLERMASILQGVDNIYEIDTTFKILSKAAELTEQDYGSDHRSDVSLRVVADHVRSAVMLIEDGVLPSNEAGGYVLRRLLRRSMRNLRLLAGAQRGGGASATDGFMHQLTAVTIDAMGEQFPELRRDAANIHAVIDAEEAAFAGTLRTGTAIFDVAVEETKRKHNDVLSGAQAFQLHDTYGFPIDLTLEMAAEQGLTVDEDGFRRLMGEQRDRARQDARVKKTGNADISVFARLLEQAGKVTFTGYDAADGEATIVGLLADGVPVPSAVPGTAVAVVLDRTPFYAEGGGQLSDQGVIRTTGPGGDAEVEVTDVQAPLPGLVVHRGTVRRGEVTTGSPAFAEIDVERRRATSRSHTATHLVHRALRGALGESAAQAGSENAPGRLRFDFTTAAGAVPLTVLREVEDEVNRVLIDDLSVRAYHTSIDEARAMGALALFGEKYGSEVRVVEVGEYSRELCGGTHVARSGQLGLVKLLGESSIGSGVRRVEALVGIDAFRFLARESVLVNQLSDQLKARPEELPERISNVVTRLRDAERELAKLRSAQLLEGSGQIAATAENLDGFAFVAHRVPDGTDSDSMRRLALDVRSKIPALQPAAVALIGAPADRPVVVIAVNEAGRGAGLSAGTLVSGAAKALGGGGGGKPDIAQGGGAPGAGPGATNAAFDSIRSALRDSARAAR
jgi:alanyl-tRNA synthetase